MWNTSDGCSSFQLISKSIFILNLSNLSPSPTLALSSSSILQVVFEGIRGKGYQGDIALDDIKITSGFCPPMKECAFENSKLCGWTNEANSIDDFDWTRQSGATSSSGTGPGFDHTSGTAQGYYMFIETSSPQKLGDKARLLSPKYTKTTGKCLRFWYHMYGVGIGTLNVRVKRMLFGRPFYFLRWSRSSDHGNLWRVAQVWALRTKRKQHHHHQQHEHSSVITQTVPLECTHQELSFEWSYL